MSLSLVSCWASEGANINWDAISAVSETIGAVAVVVTLIYLAKQIRHGNEVAKIASYHAAIQQILHSALDPDFSLYFSKYENGEQMSDADKTRASTLGVAFLFGHEILYHLYRKGQVDETLWNNILENNLYFLKSSMLLPILKDRPGQLSRDLLQLVDSR